jgi:hypothetical protein
MLEMKSNCESCAATLEAGSADAFICPYECTWCKDCATNMFEFVCPNCGGSLVQRPPRVAKE